MLIAALLAPLLAGALLSCRPPDEHEPGALVLIVIDTLRGDRIGAAGYPSASTPTLDSLAAAGVRFEDVTTAAPVTLPSVSTILTGRWPFHHGVRDNDGFVLAGDQTTLARRFQEKGWRTAAVVASGVLSADRGLAGGFDSYDDRFGGSYPVYTPALEPLAGKLARDRRRADTVTDLAGKALDGFGGDHFLLFVHYFDVHMYYDPPPRYAALHPGSPYDGEVSFVDAEVGRLLAEVRARRPDALVMVTADHGESQNEHGEPQHGFLLYQSTLHVPWIAAGPGVPAGAVRRDPVSLADLEPTMERVFSLPGGGAPRDGRALVWDRPRTEERPLYSETFRTLVSYGWHELRSVREGRWKLIVGVKPELYDLQADPHELHPVDDPAVEARLAPYLEVVEASDDPAAVLAGAAHDADPSRREMLESLGYLNGSGAAPVLRVDRPDPATELPRWEKVQWSREAFRQVGALLRAGRQRPAAALLDSVLAVNPELADAWFVRGTMKEKADDPAGARRDYRTAVERDSTDVRALAALARMAEAARRNREAFTLWTRVFRADPTDPDALGYLVDWHLGRNELREAMPFLRRLASVRPDDPAVVYNLALAARRLGREDEARRNFREYLKLDPEGRDADAVRKYLED